MGGVGAARAEVAQDEHRANRVGSSAAASLSPQHKMGNAMPSEAQYVELGKLVREGMDWFHIHRANNSEALGKAIMLAQTMLAPWAERQVSDRLDKDAWEAEDMLHETSARIVARFDSLEATTGKDFLAIMKKIVENLIHDQERLRRAYRRKRGGETLSLDRDAQAARLAELLVDEQPTGETVAMLHELKDDVRRAMKRLTRLERFAVRQIMTGIPLARMIEIFGPNIRAAWRRARLTLREALAVEEAAA